MYKAVVFDYGNVLCRVDRGAIDAAFARHSSLTPDEVGKLIWGGDIEHDAETGRYDSLEHFRRIRERIDGNPAWTYEEFCDEYRSAISPNQDGEDALLLVKEKGLRSFVVSSTTWLHASCMANREVLSTVPELYILSFRIGYMKPDPRLWLKLFDYVRLDPGDCLYIDDIPAYCDAAAALGFGTLVYDFSRDNLLQTLGGML